MKIAEAIFKHYLIKKARKLRKQMFRLHRKCFTYTENVSLTPPVKHPKCFLLSVFAIQTCHFAALCPFSMQQNRKRLQLFLKEEKKTLIITTFVID